MDLADGLIVETNVEEGSDLGKRVKPRQDLAGGLAVGGATGHLVAEALGQGADFAAACQRHKWCAQDETHGEKELVARQRHCTGGVGGGDAARPGPWGQPSNHIQPWEREPPSDTLCDWLGELVPPVRALFANGKRIPQEHVGGEYLRECPSDRADTPSPT
jgi:hypothetical protein